MKIRIHKLKEVADTVVGLEPAVGEKLDINGIKLRCIEANEEWGDFPCQHCDLHKASDSCQPIICGSSLHNGVSRQDGLMVCFRVIKQKESIRKEISDDRI